MRSANRPHLSPTSRAERGFSLVEMLVALLLSSVLMLAVFHINATFHGALGRMDEISKIQQTMKVTRSMLERRIRAAGAGMAANTVTSCGGTHQIGPFIIHNGNGLTGQDLVAGDVDTDPDWFEVMAADLNRNGVLSKDNPVVSSEKDVRPEDVSKFRIGDIIGLAYKGGMCIRMVTDVQPGPGKIQHRPAGNGVTELAKCYNNSQLDTYCRDQVYHAQHMPAGSEIVNFSAGTFAMRVDTTSAARPMLMMAAGSSGGDPQYYDWQPVAANVEDMQIAVHVDTSNPADELGDVWVNSRDLTAAEIAMVRAVRISLVFRSAAQIPGFRIGRRPALEDRLAATADDGYVRRVLTMVVKLRNKGTEATP